MKSELDEIISVLEKLNIEENIIGLLPETSTQLLIMQKT